MRYGFAIAFFILGVPLLACGARLIGDGGGPADGASASPARSDEVVDGNPNGDTPTASSFGPFPCTANTAAYESCAPSGATGGCQRWISRGNPPQGIDPNPGENVAPGCRLEIVAPTSTGGTTCARTDCLCDTNGAWKQTSRSEPALPCPTRM